MSAVSLQTPRLGGESGHPVASLKLIPFRSLFLIHDSLIMHFNRRHLLTTLLFALPVGANAGAWEAGSFDNDDAMDWVATCVRSNGAVAVSKALENSLKPSYLEAPAAAEAIAAAEVVAAARGKPSPKLPKSLGAWLQGQSKEEIARLGPIASRAVDRILIGKGSELQELWTESKSYGSWQGQMRDLLGRLR
jgi:hypothetical protein